MEQKNYLLGKKKIVLLLVVFSIIAAAVSAAAAEPIVMEDHFKIQGIEDLEIEIQAGEKFSPPAKVEVEFQNNIKAEFPVAWEKDGKLSYQKEGNYQLKGKIKIKDYPNPLIEQRADPFIHKHSDGYYYFTASHPDYDRIVMRRAKTIEGLKEAEEKVVWWKHDKGEMSQHIWAPELHYIDGKWYIYFAASRANDIWNIRQYALENDSANPLKGEWEEKGKIEMNFEEFTLDATAFSHQGKRYLSWAQKKHGDSDLYIAELKSPWEINGEQKLIAEPIYDWEKKGFNVNEGSAVIKKGDKIFISYSASATDSNYTVGLLTADQDADLLDPDSWSKYEKPIFKSSEITDEYGPGHNSFTADQNGNDILVYHSRSYKEIEGNPLYDSNRHTRVQRLFWDQNNNPVFGIPGYEIKGNKNITLEIKVE